MASVTGMTVEALMALLGPNLIDGRVDENGQLILLQRDGTEINAGPIADVSSPQFTGNPTAPTPATNNSSKSLATTEYVKNQGYAPLANPTFTGDAKVSTTPATGDNDTSIANTAFVQAAIAAAKSLYQRSGTTAERNAIFGTPAAGAPSIAMANSKIVWFNTEKGWAEMYYETNDLTNASTPGLLDGVPRGWYPTGPGPWSSLTGSPTVSANNKDYDKLLDYGVSEGKLTSSRRGGAEWFTRSASALSVKRAGMYDVSAQMFFPNGGGTYIATLLVKNSAGTELAGIQQAIPLLSSYGQVVPFSAPRLYIPEGGSVAFRINQGVGNVQAFELRADYAGPALAFTS